MGKLILDNLLPQTKKNLSSNRWVDLIDESKDMGWWRRHKLKQGIEKSLDGYNPTISDLHEMANAIQILGTYYLYYNSEINSRICSYTDKGADIIRINIEDDFAILIRIKNVNVKLTVYNPEEVFSKQWTENNLETVAENKYEEVLFTKVTEYLLRYFRELIIDYMY